jgi:hypothetical protein
MRFSKILYVVLLYPGIVGTLYALVDPTGPIPGWFNPLWALLVWGVAVAAAASLVIASAIRDGARDRAARLLRSMAWFKFVLIPVFVFNFILAVELVVGIAGILTLLVGIVGPLTGWVLGATWVAITYAVFLPTSADGIAFLIVLRRRREIGLAAFVVHLALHLLFVADLISNAVLLVTYWNRVVSRGDPTVVSGGDGAAARTVEATA